jgi:uncharacterized membrane protein/mono/diheme cytochrome c family protein
MQDFLFFVGRFHVLVLHLPIGIVIVAVVLDWLARGGRAPALARVSPFLWGAAAISAVATGVLGYLHFAEGGFTGPSAEAHRLFGTITAIECVGVWWLSRSGPSPGALRLSAGILTLALVSVTGHYGGNLTHGSTYLIEYAPGFLRSLIGAEERRPPVTSVAAADPYLDVVRPLLERRCGTCHNDDKRESGFSVGSYDSTLVGGDTGLAVVPGNLEASELYYRITLPSDDEAFMPAEGKTPPTAEQIEILRWWIAAGAPHDTTVGAVGAADVEAILAVELGLADAPASASSAPRVAADPALVERLFAAGFLARQVSQDDAHLVVAMGSPSTRLDDARIAALAAAAPTIVDLNLAGTDLDDAELAAIGALPVVTHLRLARNRLTDNALATLATLHALEHLNLYGNAGITDSGLATLAASGSLRELYLWQTAATPAGVARLRDQRAELIVDLGDAATATH